jgi:hypothetical protein
MGYYFRFDFLATLKKDLPQEIIIQLVNYIYNDAYFDEVHNESYKEDYRKLFVSDQDLEKLREPAHKFFSEKRWHSIFTRHCEGSCSYRPGFFKKWVNETNTNESEYWQLQLSGDINCGLNEIAEFVDWITPYIAGRKKHTYVGWYQGEDQEKRINIYVDKSVK